jgi:hypothetical protein
LRKWWIGLRAPPRAGGKPPVESAKMKGLLKGLRYSISQIFGKHNIPDLCHLNCVHHRIAAAHKAKRIGWMVPSHLVIVRPADAKEPEMKIGSPTDVKHVAHIGWDNASSVTTPPSWVTSSSSLSDPILGPQISPPN